MKWFPSVGCVSCILVFQYQWWKSHFCLPKNCVTNEMPVTHKLHGTSDYLYVVESSLPQPSWSHLGTWVYILCSELSLRPEKAATCQCFWGSLLPKTHKLQVNQRAPGNSFCVTIICQSQTKCSSVSGPLAHLPLLVASTDSSFLGNRSSRTLLQLR
jgi:hypothetical protein